MIECSHLTVQYPDGSTALHDLSISIGEGESVTVIGANGAGKSTLMLTLTALLLPSAGTAEINGISLCAKEAERIRAEIGMLFQNPDDQLFMPRIEDDVAFGPRNQGKSEREVAALVSETLSQLHIAHLRTRSPLKLSGGEKRMAALATILAMKPRILLLDEPSSFLDPKARRALMKEIDALPQTKLITTHDLRFATALCDRVVILKNGELFYDGVPDILYDAMRMDEAGLEAIES